MAYFIGPKKVECTPMANSASSISGMASECTAMCRHASSSPAAPTSMMAISQAFTMRMIFALSRISANWPESEDSTKKGMMNTPEEMALNRASAASEL